MTIADRLRQAREAAAQARRLAVSVLDREARERLLALAEEYEAKAQELARQLESPDESGPSSTE